MEKKAKHIKFCRSNDPSSVVVRVRGFLREPQEHLLERRLPELVVLDPEPRLGPLQRRERAGDGGLPPSRERHGRQAVPHPRRVRLRLARAGNLPLDVPSDARHVSNIRYPQI
eukprot:30871-Pelagococcus_subviridis.AAC.4